MRLSYHHANPGGGNESFLLRYQSGRTGDNAVCVLVDAGADIHPEGILEPDDQFAAICLTHAHLDHYQSLETCWRPGTPIYASAPTVDMLDDVFDVATRDFDVQAGDAMRQAIETIGGWTQLAPGVTAHPIPAGHAPGAVGYLFKFADGDETRHVLATGDFTQRRTAGYPGLDADSFLDIDVLFLTVATDNSFSHNLSSGLAQALQRADSGSRTLVATSGQLGVQAAYLLDALAEEYSRPVKIRVVGQVAKLYETLEYDCDRVESTEVFCDPETCLERGTITVAGPEVPRERSSGNLFESLRSDPGACVIQLLGAGVTPIRDAECTIDDYRVVNHPTRETLEDVHDAIGPHYTVAVHRHRGVGRDFNDLDSVVWSPTVADEYELYDDGRWIAPPWMSRRNIRTTTNSAMADSVASLTDELSLPSLARHETVDLEGEGVDLDRVEEVLAQQAAYGAPLDDPTPTDTTEPPATESTPSAADGGVPTQMASDNHDTTDDGDTEATDTDGTTPDRFDLVDRPLGAPDGIDQRLIEAVESGALDPDDLVTAHRIATGKIEPPDDPPAASNEAGSETDDDDIDDREQAPAEPPDQEAPADDGSATAETTEGESGAEVETEATTRTEDGVEDPDAPGGDVSSAETASDGEDTAETASDGLELVLSPLTIALTTAGGDDSTDETREAFIAAAVRSYLRGVVDGTVTPPDSPPEAIRIEGGAGLDRALETFVEQTDAFEDLSTLLSTAVGETLAPDSDPTVTVPELDPYRSLIDGLVENEQYPVSSRADVVAVAVRHRVADLSGPDVKIG